jgi:hypothetical protein
MAHERIYQITTKPLSSDEYITEFDFIEHWFIGTIADYVTSRDVDRNEKIQNLRNSLEEKQVVVFESDDSFILLPGGKEKYFQNEFKKFTEAAKKAANITLEEFAGSSYAAEIVRHISTSFCEKFGNYVSSNEFDTIPFDRFIREAEIGTRYYINGVIDYHW